MTTNAGLPPSSTEEPKPQAIEAGTIICFTSGAYSDFGIVGHFITLERLTPAHVAEARDEAVKRYDEQCVERDRWRPHQDVPYPFVDDKKDEAFVAALIRKGLLRAIDPSVIHLGERNKLNDAAQMGPYWRYA